MKIASKFIAALAVVASFSSFAADPIEGLAEVSDLAGAIELAGDGSTSLAAILQTGGTSFAAIEQTGANGAVVVQAAADASASVVQTGEGNLAIIFQGE
jgi:ABC-type phosphate transport system substrate-binding protein